jgi:hypothetical protein
VDVASPVLCQIAQQRHRHTTRWLQLYNLLIFTLSAVVIVFAAVTLVLYVREEALGSLVTGAGTAVTGTGVAWVLKRRGDAKQEEKAAFDGVVEHCGDRKPAEDERSGATFLGVR